MRRRCIKELKGVISSGKEARVYWSKGFNNEDLAVKIYLTSTAEFRKGILKYIKGDPRYEWITSLPTHKLMAVWARKEYSNLKHMYDAGVRVPKPLCVYRNILVMEFLGENGVRAPLLKELNDAKTIDSNMAERFFIDIIDNIYKIYWNAKLVHGDLSEYNVMVYRDLPYIIDVSQAVKIDHPNAHDFLYRDIQNIVRFFSSEIGIKTPKPEELFNRIVRGVREFT